MKISSVFQSKHEKALRKHAYLINKSVGGIDRDLLACISEMLPYLGQLKFDYAFGISSQLDRRITLQRKSIETYITLRVKPIFEETTATFSVTLEDIKKQEPFIIY